MAYIRSNIARSHTRRRADRGQANRSFHALLPRRLRPSTDQQLPSLQPLSAGKHQGRRIARLEVRDFAAEARFHTLRRKPVEQPQAEQMRVAQPRPGQLRPASHPVCFDQPKLILMLPMLHTAPIVGSHTPSDRPKSKWWDSWWDVFN